MRLARRLLQNWNRIGDGTELGTDQTEQEQNWEQNWGPELGTDHVFLINSGRVPLLRATQCRAACRLALPNVAPE